jgi:hypothetical protein
LGKPLRAARREGLALLLAYLAFGAIFRAIGLAVRLAVILALASAICTLAGMGVHP